MCWKSEASGNQALLVARGTEERGPFVKTNWSQIQRKWHACSQSLRKRVAKVPSHDRLPHNDCEERNLNCNRDDESDARSEDYCIAWPILLAMTSGVCMKFPISFVKFPNTKSHCCSEMLWYLIVNVFVEETVLLIIRSNSVRCGREAIASFARALFFSICLFWKTRENEANLMGVKRDWIQRLGVLQRFAQSSDELCWDCLFSWVSLWSFVAVFLCHFDFYVQRSRCCTLAYLWGGTMLAKMITKIIRKK